MADKKFPQSELPIRRTVELLPTVFQTSTNEKFMAAVVDPLVQPGVLQKTVGYVGRRYGKTYSGKDIYLDSDNTLRSRYQLEPAVIYKDNNEIQSFYDYLDFKNQIKFFGNDEEQDSKVTSQEHYSWNPPINWDKFINYREYYWEPSGPPTVSVSGQKASITSTYKVSLGVNSFVLTPDSYTNNPTLTLYRGQTYKFNVNAPDEGFQIRRNYDIGSLTYNPLIRYAAGSIVVFDKKLWKALVEINAGDGSSITPDTQDWQFIESVAVNDPTEYSNGVTNNGIQNGTLTFVVPMDAPDVLFYQSPVDPNKFGRLVISNIESNTKINIEKEILGKTNYTSSNGVEFTNGLVVEFLGQVTPSKYATDSWLIEGVGTAITLTRFADLVVPVITTDVPEVLFDNDGFDTQPFDDATQYPGQKDYITISRDSIDRNPWSRYNRWFHRSVLEYAYSFRGQDFSALESLRAKRPIIEFEPNIQLFNHGSVAKEVVDYVDDYTTDIFSKIEGSTSYNIDGEFIFEGARILVTADTDNLANNKIYQVSFITHNNRKQITLKEVSDSESINGQAVLVRRGNVNGGLMFHYNGTSWLKSQAKTKVNQQPLFDAFDTNGVSFADVDTYPVSTFTGTELFGYKIGNGITDAELGFSLSYLNIDNVGDIQFNWKWDTESFYYNIDQVLYHKKISTGYYKFNPNDTYKNGWIVLNNEFSQPIIDSVKVTAVTPTVTLTTVDWTAAEANTATKINFYVNGDKITSAYTRQLNDFTFATPFAVNDIVSVKVVSDVDPVTGYYEIPVGLEKNPLNDDLTTFTLGQAIDHVKTSLEFDDRFTGVIPGSSNLRDLNDYQVNAKRFLKHSGLTPLAVTLLTDKNHNIIKSIQYAKKSYTEFKNNFLNKSVELEFNDNIPDFVDTIISELSKTKTSSSPFSDSDMIGAGAFTSIVYNVEDVGIKTFTLTEKFTLTELSRRAVYVYVNNQQLLNTRDYVFNSTFGFVTLLVTLSEGDTIEIREYVSTAFNHIPPTPTSIGLYKKYTPMMFVDDTYVESQYVIQGHDGSITIAYGDYRDDLLLELEYRIYNNIKQEYNESVFDIDAIAGGYYGNGFYTKPQIDAVIKQEFLKWVQNTNINYTINEWFDSENSFTYTYSNMVDPTGQQNLPGYWRGVYKWFYDTDRPHRCPWEMLGFSEKPTWWESYYGPAPYTKNNEVLWEDLAGGVIREGTRAGVHDRYKRGSLLRHIPVDADGNLLSPLESGLAGNFTLVNNRGSFVIGDVSPPEYAWRSSSEYPFAIAMAMCLMKPFEFISDSFDRSKTTVNKLGQTVNVETQRFTTLSDIQVPAVGTLQSSGLSQYLASYIKSKGGSLNDFQDKLSGLDVALSTRLSGFVDKAQQKYLLDSKNPKSSSSSIFIPPENYDIIFNISAPISSVSYSGVIVEKTGNGWVINGYDNIHPFFNYYAAVPSQSDPVITVGGVSETFVEWTTNKAFNLGQVTKYRDSYYRALTSHNSGASFDMTVWKKLPKLPTVNGVDALRRKTFDRLTLSQMSYGAEFNSIQAVVDFLLGYEAYLISIGFTFNRYDTVNQVSQDWTTSCKEFMFWTKHNWAEGSLITLSPSAEFIDVTIPVGVADNILDGFYDYQILKGDGKPLDPSLINVNRSFQNITVEPVNTTEAIYYLKLYYVLKENVAVFSDKTVFNDIIYDKPTGYRQDRIKTQGYRTVDWDGDYTSPGFLFDNVNIAVWQPFTDYKLGDIVSYRSYNWTSQVNQVGQETFDDTKWTKLDSTPSKSLVSNFDYKINQFEDYFEVTAEGAGESQRDLARHSIGYQTRTYLQNLSEDPITQFQLYQGFVREKGTSDAITKVFNKLSRSGDTSIELNEEWAFRVGRFGGVDQMSEIELTLYKDNFVTNPQTLLVVNSKSDIISDQHYRIPKTDFTVEPTIWSTAINPVSYDAAPTQTAGYVKTTHVDVIVSTKDSILDLAFTDISENDHVWVTLGTPEWTVLRYNESPLLRIVDVIKSGTSVTVTLSRRHTLSVGDIVGIDSIANLTGFFKITEVTPFTIVVTVAADATDPVFDLSTVANLNIFTEARFDNYPSMDVQAAALLPNNAKMWVDNNGSNLWEVIQKKKQFTNKDIVDYGVTDPLSAGTTVLYSELLKQTISSMPMSGYVTVYLESTTGLVLKQIVAPAQGFESNVVGSFGSAMALSPDNKFLIIASPNASGITNNYKGPFDPTVSYVVDDIVLYEGHIYRAVNDVAGLPAASMTDSTWISVYTDDWVPATSIPATTLGTDAGYSNQGMISIYEYKNQQWEIHSSFVSPRPAADEQFGSAVVVGKNGSSYYLAVSAIGSRNNRGRVYLYTFDGTEWTHAENANYKGVFSSSEDYEVGTIVWYDESLWEAQIDITGDGSTIGVDEDTSGKWLKVDPVSTRCSLPQNISLDDDGSTFLEAGLLSPTQLAELVKVDDKFGHSLAMNYDATILAIGAPNSDGQYFANYRGYWRMDIDYTEGDVVRVENKYYKLFDPRLHGEDWDSTVLFTSIGDDPSNGDPWEDVGDSTLEASGKVYVYQLNQYGTYTLIQTINAGSLLSINDIVTTETIASGDKFGWAMTLDYSGSTLLITSPESDINFRSQGTAYVFRTSSTSSVEYRLKQKLESYEIHPNEYFGQSVAISANTERIVIGAKNSPFTLYTRFDTGVGTTTFDQGKTNFISRQGYAGAVYVFERKLDEYFLTEKLEATLSQYESFGYSVSCTDSYIAVGSPDYVVDAGTVKQGIVRLFSKTDTSKSWDTLLTESPVVDISKIKSIALYDNVKNIKLQDIDYVDHAKLKILSLAEQEIKFKTPYDPAVYTIGTEDQVVDATTAWGKKNVGQIWWNISTAKWINYEQGDLSYRVGNWNTLAKGASIDVYEWVETVLLPSEWAALADTNEGIAEGISGQPLYPNDNVYTVKVLYNAATSAPTSTLYYYWVKNKVVVPSGVAGRRISSSEITSLISNPAGSGNSFIALIDADKFLAYNLETIMSSDTALLNIQYLKNNKALNPIHNEYQLLTEGVADSLPSVKLEAKWIDSIVGTDSAGNRVPDPNLPAKQKYGIEFRPRQSMFVDRTGALKILVENVNTILLEEAFADSISFNNLNLVEQAPDESLNLYDIVVDTDLDLTSVGTVRTRQAKLQANIVDGQIDTIDIIDSGFGYKPKTLVEGSTTTYVGPPVVIQGTGSGAVAKSFIDGQGRVTSVTIVSRGKKYSTASATIRNYAVLVTADSTANNFWSIYAWDDNRRVFFRSDSQAYDTTKYWTYIDWWKTGYGLTSRIVREILTVSEEQTITTEVGDLIRIKEYANGGWAVFEKISSTGTYFLDMWQMVGRKNGTIQISTSLYDIAISGIGYGNADQPFDTSLYDVENSAELRNILKAVKEDILIGNYAVEWNKLFFNSVRYAFAEQQYVDWAFKTSFLNATHNIGSLEKKTNYKNDNLTSFQEYINEVKPYRTTVREYVSRYNTVEPVGSAFSDFDLPPAYSVEDGKVVSIDKYSDKLNSYPWKWWTDNNGYSVVDISISNGGSGYTTVPTVLITGNGTGATAQAYISNGKVSGIKIIDQGRGYTAAPTITLVGGNAAGQQNAIAVAILGDSKARTFNVGIKFDRLAKEGYYTDLTIKDEEIIASGATAVYDLKYAPTRDKSKITIYKNSQLVLNSEYTINLYKSSTDTYSLLKGKIAFNVAPAKDDVILISYEKNDELLDSVNRIEKYYSPVAGMKNKDLNQLMTGIDFGGVQIQGTTFEVTGGWDALPWFTDSWDSVESSADYYVVCDGSTNEVTLPFVPTVGQEITIYLKRAGSAIPSYIDTLGPDGAPVVVQYPTVDAPKTIRIDSLNYNPLDDSSTSVNPTAQMPTFIGDGVNNVVDIGSYISTTDGDILIFRPIDSDGSVVINDPNLLDTKLSGGTLSAMSGAYATATGTLADDISIDGGNFIQPENVPAPEENVPGQVLDSVSIKVYNSTVSGTAPLQSKVIISDGSTKLYNIDLNILESNSLMVYVDKVKNTDYTVNFQDNTFEFNAAPVVGAIIEIFAVGIGGINLLDYQEFEADGDTSLFLTSANYAETSKIFVTLNGTYTDAGFVDSTEFVETTSKTMVQFAFKPAKGDIVKIVCLGANSDTDLTGLSIVRVNRQQFEFEGSTRSFDLDNFVELSRASSLSSMVVEVNGTILKGVDTEYFTYDGVVNEFLLGVDPEESAGTILPSNVKVFVNDILQTFIQDYVYDGTTKVLTINTDVLSVGDVIKIENDFRTEYSVVDNTLTINSDVTLSSTDETTNDIINVTWFGEYPSMKIISDEMTGGKVQYQLKRSPLGIEYVWAYKNGNRLIKDKDYYISLNRNVIYLTELSETTDIIKVITFGSEIYRLPSAFEIQKDMLNVYHFKRYSTTTVELAQPLNYYDQEIVVNDGTDLFAPIQSRNIPGVVCIQGEKIEYMVKTGNVLSQLRRGSLGTPIGNSYSIGSSVVDSGPSEVIPYNENQERADFVSDGSSKLIGPLEYVPTKSVRTGTWYKDTIPADHGPCDQIEVFVGGKRLRKDPIAVFDEAKGPQGESTLEAEFSVDGTTNYIQLTSAVAAGTRITIIKRVGQVWYNRGATTASNGITLLENTTAIATFIAQKSTKLPE